MGPPDRPLPRPPPSPEAGSARSSAAGWIGLSRQPPGRRIEHLVQHQTARRRGGAGLGARPPGEQARDLLRRAAGPARPRAGCRRSSAPCRAGSRRRPAAASTTSPRSRHSASRIRRWGSRWLPPARANALKSCRPGSTAAAARIASRSAPGGRRTACGASSGDTTAGADQPVAVVLGGGAAAGVEAVGHPVGRQNPYVLWQPCVATVDQTPSGELPRQPQMGDLSPGVHPGVGAPGADDRHRLLASRSPSASSTTCCTASALGWRCQPA